MLLESNSLIEERMQVFKKINDIGKSFIKLEDIDI